MRAVIKIEPLLKAEAKEAGVGTDKHAAKLAGSSRGDKIAKGTEEANSAKAFEQWRQPPDLLHYVDLF